MGDNYENIISFEQTVRKRGVLKKVLWAAVPVLLIWAAVIGVLLHSYLELTDWCFRLLGIDGIEGPYTSTRKIKYKMVYSRIVWGHLEVGIYPELTPEVEERIRALGSPYSSVLVRYKQADKEHWPEYSDGIEYFDIFIRENRKT